MDIDEIRPAPTALPVACVLKISNQFLFFASTEMTDSWVRRKSIAFALMYWNWASRSMCYFPALVLLSACRL